MSSLIPLHNIVKCWQCETCCTPCTRSHSPLTQTYTVCPHQDLPTTGRADHVTHLFGIPATTTDVLAVLTASKGLKQRLEADVKEAWILLAGRHGCRGYVATVTDSREGTGRQDEALRPDWLRGRTGERQRRAASVADVAAVCCWVCVCVRLWVHEHRKLCLCVGYLCQIERKRELHSASPVRCVAI